MSDKNVLKFKKPKPQTTPRKAPSPGRRSTIVWLLVVLGIAAVWACYRYLAPQSL